MHRLAKWVMAATATLVAVAGSAAAQVNELRIGYQPSPIQDASIAMFETWGAKNGIKIVKVPNSYGVYVEKMTASLTSNSDQYDVIWHNDDWGQTWAHLLEPTDDVDANKYADKWGMAPVVFANAQGQNTVVPMGQTFSVFFYRSDLVKPEEVPKTLAELVTVSKALQAAGNVKFGYVGGMSMNHTWFSWFWSMWGNNCDVLMPAYERDNKKLAEAGWKSGMTEPCMQQTVEYWWDAINTHKISPPGMTAYGRNEANAIFMAGDAAFTLVDSTHFGEFSDPKRSKIVGNIGMAPFPVGPRAKMPTSWNEIWGWAIPIGVPAEKKKLVKEMLSAMMSDEAGQIEMWKKTGGPPPNVKLWVKLRQEDKDFDALMNAVFDQKPITHSAYYFAEWPAVHKAYSDAVISAMSGKREDIPKVLQDNVEKVRRAGLGTN